MTDYINRIGQRTEDEAGEGTDGDGPRESVDDTGRGYRESVDDDHGYRDDGSDDTARVDMRRTEPIDPRPPTLEPTAPPKRRPIRVVLAMLLVAAVAAAIAFPAGQRAAETEPAPAQGAAAAPAPEPAPPPASLDAPSPVPEIAERVLPTVAQVRTDQGAGSAVIYRTDGFLVTNDHVVANANEVEVILADGQRRDAEIVGTAAPFTDLAVLEIDETGLPAAEFRDGVPRIGSTAVAMGSPFGLDATVTVGVVSATDRELQGGGQRLGGLIQTDAAINPGNSGGALVDDRGRVVGINTAIFSGSGTSSGVGFAVPSTTVIAMVDQIIENGEVNPGFLGISGQSVTPDAAEAFGVPEGAVVMEVRPGTPADEAGLQPEDVIVEFDGVTIDSMIGLSSRVTTRQPGDEVTIGYVRDGERLQTTVTLAEMPEQLN